MQDQLTPEKESPCNDEASVAPVATGPGAPALGLRVTEADSLSSMHPTGRRQQMGETEPQANASDDGLSTAHGACCQVPAASPSTTSPLAFGIPTHPCSAAGGTDGQAVEALAEQAVVPSFARLSMYSPDEPTLEASSDVAAEPRFASASSQPFPASAVERPQLQRTSWSAGSLESGRPVAAGGRPQLGCRSMNAAAARESQLQEAEPATSSRRPGLLSRVKNGFSEVLQSLLSTRRQERCEVYIQPLQTSQEQVLQPPPTPATFEDASFHNGSDIVLSALPDIAEELEEVEQDEPYRHLNANQ